MGRKAWIWMLLALVVAVLLIAAWIDAGRKPLRWIEQPVAAPADEP